MIGVEFGFNDVALYAELRRPESQRVIPQEQMLRDEAIPILQAWSLEARIRQVSG